MTSLKWRLTVGLLIGLVSVLLLFGVVVNVTIRYLSEDFVASRLGHDAESLLSGLSLEKGRPILPPSGVDAIYERAYSGHYFLVMGPEEPLRSRSLWDFQLQVDRVAPGEQRRQLMAGPGEQELLIRAAGYRLQGHAVTIAVAEDVSVIEGSLRRFNIGFGVLMLAAIAGIAAVQGAIVHRAFRPLEGVRQAMQRLESGEIERLPEGVPLEIQPLVGEVNRLLMILRRRVDRSRNALGNLAHALKGPLNLLLRATERNPEAGLEEAVTRIRSLVEHELRRARIVGSVSPGRRFRPAEELPAMVMLLQRVYEERALVLDWEAPRQLDLPYDRDDMLELLGNLLDNACKWAHHRVRVTLDARHFVVEDDGPGREENELERMMQRGVRIDESMPGHGLGLSIVREITDSYGADLSFARSPSMGGLQVTITFPARS